MGRPSKYTPELIEGICARLATGEPMAQICRDEGMPDVSTIWDWQQTKPEVSQSIARAREIGFDAIAEQTLEIADDSRNDWMVRKADEGDEKALQFNGEHVQRSRLRVETRLKLLAKWDPKRYGEKLDLSHSGSIETTSNERIDARIAELARKAGVVIPAGGKGPADADEPAA